MLPVSEEPPLLKRLLIGIVVGMARPRKHVTVIEHPNGSLERVENGQGREVTGLSFNASNRAYYTIDPTGGKRQYLGRALLAAVEAVEGPRTYWTREHANEMIDADNAVDEIARALEFADPATRAQIATDVRNRVFNEPEQHKPRSKERLSDCLDFWVAWVTNDGNEPETANVEDTRARFRRFIQCVNNLPISAITHNDFVNWQKRVRSQKTWKSVKTKNDHHATVTKILSLAKRKQRDWLFPDGLLEWANDWKLDKRQAYAPKPKNKEPMPVDVLARCLAVADEWASIDLESIDKTTQKGKGKRRQARTKQRHGVQFAAILRLAVHGLDTVDLTRIKWNNLHLDADLPYFDFPRTKVEHKTGYAIDRKTPLLPSCVEALKRWRDYDGTGEVFKNDRAAAFNSSVLGNAFQQLRDNGDDWTLKHLRNVGGTLADKYGMSEMKVDRFLGHTLKKGRAHYLGSVDQTYFVDLVNLIGRDYFDGETVGA